MNNIMQMATIRNMENSMTKVYTARELPSTVQSCKGNSIPYPETYFHGLVVYATEF